MSSAALAPFDFDRTFDFPVSVDELWSRFEDVEAYPSWWRWLRRFETQGGSTLGEGVVADCAVRGPLPYEVRLSITVDDLVPRRRVETTVDGDLRGKARLELDGDGTSSRARLVWNLDVIDPALRALTRVARPLMVWGHDVVVSRGVRQFRRGALGAP